MDVLLVATILLSVGIVISITGTGNRSFGDEPVAVFAMVVRIARCTVPVRQWPHQLTDFITTTPVERHLSVT
jgi:hypothetical protein